MSKPPLVKINAKLVTLCKEIADLTHEACSGRGSAPCRQPYSCCHPSVCELVIEQAKWDWDASLPRTNHPQYPLMNPDGSCSAPPHMRPLCAAHCCCIQNFGCNPKDTEWSRKYWQLRDDINYLLSQKASFKP